MQIELAEVIAEDGLRLHGGLLLPAAEQAEAPPPTGCDAVVVVHGTGSNFYSSTLLKLLARQFSQWGTAALLVNTRGHDGLSTAGLRDPDSGLFRPRKVGAAYEKVEECRFDLTAWIDWLAERGYVRVGLVGHSLGAVKVLLLQAHHPHPNVAWVVAVSPPRLSYSHFVQTPRAPGFLADLERAEKELAEGRPETLLEVRFPLPYVVSAEGFVEKYGRQDRYNLLSWINRVSQPVLVTYGGTELEQGLAFRHMPEALEALSLDNVRVAIVAGGDHQYTGVQSSLTARIESWLRKSLPGS